MQGRVSDTTVYLLIVTTIDQKDIETLCFIVLLRVKKYNL